MDKSIPKIIHYCWFGGKPLPKMANKCIASLKKYLPDYEIKQWDESNFDVNIIPYTQQAYEAKKYAFVSDYARFWILYNYGGLYFDTDVKVIKSMEDRIMIEVAVALEGKDPVCLIFIQIFFNSFYQTIKCHFGSIGNIGKHRIGNISFH